jgi:hypothetical protein
MIVGNVFVQQDDEVRILHASAALGTAVFQKGGETWEQAQAFDWRCRSTDDGKAAQAEREAFLRDEGWVSVNSRIGAPNELEFKIAAPRNGFRLAVNVLRSSDPGAKHPWPSDLDDDCIKPTPGGLPSQMRFQPDRWAMIELPGGL